MGSGFVPTFYVQPCWGGFSVSVSNSDNGNQPMVLARGFGKRDAVAKAKKAYFGKVKSTDKVKIVWL